MPSLTKKYMPDHDFPREWPPITRSVHARKIIEPYLVKTTDRWPIYHGPETPIKGGCEVAILHSYSGKLNWDRYEQCCGNTRIIQDDIFYCKVHDPDKKWPRITKVYQEKMKALKVEIPDGLRIKQSIEIRKKSDNLSFFEKIARYFRKG